MVTDPKIPGRNGERVAHIEVDNPMSWSVRPVHGELGKFAMVGKHSVEHLQPVQNMAFEVKQQW